MKGEAHKKDDLPDTIDQARELARSLGIEPTEEIHSGHGLQAWWLLRKPWIFRDDDDRKKAADLVRRFQALLRAQANAKGWEIDSTHDLPRILRLPGTWNHKAADPVRVRVLQADGLRYGRGDLLALVRKLETSRPRGAERKARAPVLTEGQRIPEGERDNTLTSLAGSMRRRGMTEEEIFASLKAVNETRCDPPLPEDQVRKVARSVAGYEPDEGTGSGEGKRESQATRLVKYAQEALELFHTAEGQAFATTRAKPRQTCPCAPKHLASTLPGCSSSKRRPHPAAKPCRRRLPRWKGSPCSTASNAPCSRASPGATEGFFSTWATPTGVPPSFLPEGGR